MVHKHVNKLPGIWLVIPEPEYAQDHDSVIPGAALVIILYVKPGTIEHGQAGDFTAVLIPGTVNLEELALPGMRTVILLAEGAAKWPATVATSVHQEWQSLVAVQADWLGVVVRTHCSWYIVE